MERYTEKHYGENGYYLSCSGNCETLNCGDCGILDKIVDRLAAIEDILGDEYDLDRLRELVQADRERRCVVTPPDPATESEYEIICRPINPEYIRFRKVFEK